MKEIKKYLKKIDSVDIVIIFALSLYGIFLINTIFKMVVNKDVVIFDLDGTLANIDARRKLATKDNGKMNWDVFFDPTNISLDLPNQPVIEMAKNPPQRR